VQTLPSLHAEPFARSLHVVVLTAGWQDWQALDGLGAPAATQAPPMMQLPAASGCEHDPLAQTSLVQAIPSEAHVAPSALLLVVHPPVPSQAEEAWQSAGVQVYAAPPQAPFVQTSAFVHEFPSLQVVPFAAIGLEQVPLVGLQTPAVWHESEAAQTTGLAPTHAPAWQVSDCVHALPSLQVVPSGAAGVEQPPVAGLHVPAA
jgi:hypothetical protein